MEDKMNHKISDEDVSQEFVEKVLQDYFCYGDSCKGWETNVITQPKTVKNIVDVGASRIAAGKGIGNFKKQRKAELCSLSLVSFLLALEAASVTSLLRF